MIKYINYFKKNFKQFETNIVNEFVGYIKKSYSSKLYVF